MEHCGYKAENMTLDMVSIFGVGTRVSSVTVNGQDVKFFYDEKIQASITFRDENMRWYIYCASPSAFLVLLFRLGLAMLV